MLMPPSPRGRQIIQVEGNPAEITARGTEIELLGEQMREAAGVLSEIKNRAEDQQGKAITTLRETIGDSYETLYESADLYEPVGPVIRAYGETLDTVQPKLNAHADNCWELWQTYFYLPGQLEPAATGADPEPGSDEAAEQEENDQKRQAYEAWEAEAGLFDTDYDTWENAFDQAVRDIGDEMSGQIEDGGWRSFLDIAGKVLGWAGLIVGVAAMIIGGPVLGIIAAVIGVLTLAVVICQAFIGDANGWDIAIAAVGVLPVGKLGKLAQGRYLEFGADTISAFKPSTYAGDSVYTLFKNKNVTDGISTLMTGSTGTQWRNDMTEYVIGGPNGTRYFYQDLGTSVYNQYETYKGWVDTGGSVIDHLPPSDSAVDRVEALQSQ
ncbi:hypothetical protein [Ruania rhizosphaerae]|uniref:hypothetical protein n=1 Tax=Ruania rhizosphaerae TaxID=1840413 RepID=UPI001357B5CB|nr:hypothetical protein [Ruania rhizosphaerae]